MSQTEDDADEIPKDAYDSTATPATETDFSGLESDVDPQQQQDFLDDLAKGLRWVIGDWGEEEEGGPPHRMEEESDVYDPDDYTSKPFFSKKCTIEPDILEFEYPFHCTPHVRDTFYLFLFVCKQPTFIYIRKQNLKVSSRP